MRLFFLLFLLLSPFASALTASTRNNSWQGSIAIGALNFNYREYIDGEQLLEESGWLPSIAGQIHYTLSSHWRFGGAIRHSSGRISYRGQTQLGQDLNTQTDESITNIASTATYTIDNHSSLIWRIGSNHWRRDILATTSTSNLQEDYTWYELEQAYVFRYPFNDHQKLRIGGALFSTLAPAVEIHLESNNPKLMLQGHIGWRLFGHFEQTLTEHTQINVSAYYKKFEFGRSETQTYSNAQQRYQIFEPDSRSQYLGIEIAINTRF